MKAREREREKRKKDKNKGKPDLRLYRLHNSAYKSMSRTSMLEISLPLQLAA